MGEFKKSLKILLKENNRGKKDFSLGDFPRKKNETRLLNFILSER